VGVSRLRQRVGATEVPSGSRLRRTPPGTNGSLILALKWITSPDDRFRQCFALLKGEDDFDGPLPWRGGNAEPGGAEMT